jgi:hypothetical protein
MLEASKLAAMKRQLLDKEERKTINRLRAVCFTE